MTLEEEILVSIEAPSALDKASKLSDFLFKATEDGSFLIDLKTGTAQTSWDDEREHGFKRSSM